MKKFTTYIKAKVKDKESIFSVLLYILLFLFLLHPYRDYDWGWHYRYGEWFFVHHSIYLKDTFTWTMPGYEWINHEWLYDPLMYLIFQYTSFLGMSIAGAIVSFTCFYLGVKRFNLSFWKKGVLALFYANLVAGVAWQGLRSQMIGSLFLGITMYLIPPAISGNKKVLYALPFFFLLFANFHGYFTMGLAFFFFAIVGSMIIHFREFKNNKEKGFFVPKNVVMATTSLFVSFCFTMINPYYYYVYFEAYKHSTSPLLKYILEWLPVDTGSTFFLIFAAFSLIIIFGFIRRRTLRDIPNIVIFIFVAYLGVTARRYMMPFAVVALPMAAAAFQNIPLRLEKYRATAFLFIICSLIGFEIGIFRRIPSYHLFNYTFQDYCDFGSNCSEGLVAYLKKYPPKGHGLNFYNWGGYLIGRGAPVKLFVDGRMHLWEGRSGFQPFLSYQKMYYDEDYERFNRDNFDWVIIDTGSDLFKKLSTGRDLGSWTVGYMDLDAAYLIRKR